MIYDFKSARQRQNDLMLYYRRLKRMGLLTPETESEILAYIDDIQQEIEEAHKSVKAKMTTVASSGHPVLQINNLVTPIVPHWKGNEQEGILL